MTTIFRRNVLTQEYNSDSSCAIHYFSRWLCQSARSHSRCRCAKFISITLSLPIRGKLQYDLGGKPRPRPSAIRLSLRDDRLVFFLAHISFQKSAGRNGAEIYPNSDTFLLLIYGITWREREEEATHAMRMLQPRTRNVTQLFQWDERVR